MSLNIKLSLIPLAIAAMSFFIAPTSAQTAETPTDSNAAVDIFYVTNRAPVSLENGGFSYGAGRSHSLAFGSVSVRAANDGVASLSSPSEIGRFPETPYPIEYSKGNAQRSSTVLSDHARAFSLMQKELARRIKEVDRHEVIVFIHGYNNSFEDAVRSASQICNDVGSKDFLCVAITWPAGGTKGVLFGYNVDRESGEFSVADVRKAIRAIGTTPGLDKLHFVAHSRGTDILSSALQQLSIEAYVSKTSLAEKLKIKNIVLAAPDMDVDVAFTRVLSVVSDPETPYGSSPNYKAKFHPGAIHVTVYASPKDKALELSKSLFGSEERLGLLDPNASGKKIELAAQAAGIADFISVENGGGFIGHSYFLSTPEVRADLAAIIREGKRPDEEGRFLLEITNPFWVLPKRQQ